MRAWQVDELARTLDLQEARSQLRALQAASFAVPIREDDVDGRASRDHLWSYWEALASGKDPLRAQEPLLPGGDMSGQPTLDELRGMFEDILDAPGITIIE